MEYPHCELLLAQRRRGAEKKISFTAKHAKAAKKIKKFHVSVPLALRELHGLRGEDFWTFERPRSPAGGIRDDAAIDKTVAVRGRPSKEALPSRSVVNRDVRETTATDMQLAPLTIDLANIQVVAFGGLPRGSGSVRRRRGR